MHIGGQFWCLTCNGYVLLPSLKACNMGLALNLCFLASLKCEKWKQEIYVRKYINYL